MDNIFGLSDKLLQLSEKICESLAPQFKAIDKIAEFNQNKVLKAFIDNGVSESCFYPTTGYGYGDTGRDTLERVFAQIVGAEDSLVRHQFMSGTHTLAVALFGILRPGDIMLSLTGTPYDTLHGVIGITKTSGSLAHFGVKYEEIPLLNGGCDFEAIAQRLGQDDVKVAYIQRSRGYDTRPSLSCDTIETLCKIVREKSPSTIVMVDNCYGEYVEKREPIEAGADLIAGSLIKNPGGNIAPCGGYIAGRADLVELCAGRLTAPNLGKEVGATLGHSREMYMGVFNAPHSTGEAVKTAVFAGKIFEEFGYEVTPRFDESRADVVQTIIFGSADKLQSFCRGLQKGMPIDAFVRPEPAPMPGYSNQVIMSAGSFIAGATSELSADGPLREPFGVWLQGAVNFHSAKTGILLGIEAMRSFAINSE